MLKRDMEEHKENAQNEDGHSNSPHRKPIADAIKELKAHLDTVARVYEWAEQMGYENHANLPATLHPPCSSHPVGRIDRGAGEEPGAGPPGKPSGFTGGGLWPQPI